MKNFITFLTLVFLSCNVGLSQELKPPKDDNVELPTLRYGASDELDTDALTQRVEDLTETVNVHTEQINELDKRLSALENVNSPVLTRAIRSKLSSKLNPVGTLRTSFVEKNSGGSTGSIVVKSPSLLSTITDRVVSIGEPVVTSVSYGPAITQASSNIRYEVSPPEPIIQPAQIVRSPATQERRRTVRVPMTQVTTQNVRYEPVSNCPGGRCAISQRPVRSLGGGLLRRVFRP